LLVVRRLHLSPQRGLAETLREATESGVVMSEVRVTIDVYIDGALVGKGVNPSHVSWEHVTYPGDNPRFWSEEVANAIEDLSGKAVDSVRRTQSK
jgi:hypothetical protein